MALVVEDGSGLTNADSYESIANADTYHANFGNETWDTYTDEQKELALRNATRYIDVKYGSRFVGSKMTSAQSLYWPRTGVVIDGFDIDDGKMPAVLKQATCEVALRYINGEDLLADQELPGTVKRELIQVGPIKSDVEYMGGQSLTNSMPEVDGIIARLLNNGGATDVILHG